MHQSRQRNHRHYHLYYHSSHGLYTMLLLGFSLLLTYSSNFCFENGAEKLQLLNAHGIEIMKIITVNEKHYNPAL